MSNESVIGRVLTFALARKLGIPIVDVVSHWERREYPYWDGSRLQIEPTTKSDVILHEIAHWYHATPEQRVLENYGLRDSLQDTETARKHEQAVNTTEAAMKDLIRAATPEIMAMIRWESIT